MDKQEFLKTVSENIKKYRAQNGLTQEKFAEKAGISLPFCAAIETERKAPSAFTLRNMADRLGVTVDYFLYQDSVQAEIKMISEQLANKPAAYVEFIGRLIAVCNDFNDTNRELGRGGIALSGQEKHVLIEAWYRQYAKSLLLYACQFVDYHSAEEVVQDTFRVAWETVQEEEIEYPKTWLRKIAKNVIKNRIREREKWKDLLANVDEVPEEALGKSEDPINVELEYEGLIDQQDLHLLKLLAIDGYTYPEAAKALDSTAEACRKRAKRAEQKLRVLLEK